MNRSNAQLVRLEGKHDFQGNRDFQTLSLRFQGYFDQFWVIHVFILVRKIKSNTNFKVLTLKKYRKNNFKHIVSPGESVDLDFSFWIQDHRIVQTLGLCLSLTALARFEREADNLLRTLWWTCKTRTRLCPPATSCQDRQWRRGISGKGLTLSSPWWCRLQSYLTIVSCHDPNKGNKTCHSCSFEFCSLYTLQCTSFTQPRRKRRSRPLWSLLCWASPVCIFQTHW